MEKLLILLFTLLLFIASCNNTIKNPKVVSQEGGNSYLTIGGVYAELDGDNLLVTDLGGSLKVIDLDTKTVRKEISLAKFGAFGLDISDDVVVWSDLRNDSRNKDQLTDFENANADIFVYDLKTSELKQITTDLSCQANPKIWKSYIIWQDNRNDTLKEYPGKWSLYLYDMNTGKEKLITSTLAPHSTISIRDNRIVWEDERNFTGDNVIRGGDNLPGNNKDIYMYDISTGVETAVAVGPMMESKPDVSGNYIVYEDRSSGTYNADIVLYDITTNKKVFITKDKYDQGTPRILGNCVVWMDERRGTSTNDVIINGKKPNSDIFIYEINSKKEKLLTGDEPQIMPAISEKWIAYINSRQVDPTVDVIKFEKLEE